MPLWKLKVDNFSRSFSEEVVSWQISLTSLTLKLTWGSATLETSGKIVYLDQSQYKMLMIKCYSKKCHSVKSRGLWVPDSLKPASLPRLWKSAPVLAAQIVMNGQHRKKRVGLHRLTDWIRYIVHCTYYTVFNAQNTVHCRMSTVHFSIFPVYYSLFIKYKPLNCTQVHLKITNTHWIADFLFSGILSSRPRRLTSSPGSASLASSSSSMSGNMH